MRFVEAADAAGEASIGTAAMIAFFWLQRQEDILTRLTWDHYRPADAPTRSASSTIRPASWSTSRFYDEDGTALWPEIMTRLDAAAAPWHPDRHARRAWTAGARSTCPGTWTTSGTASPRSAPPPGIDPEVKFMGLRHGGNVEGAEADLTDAQLRALSGHRTTAALLRYAQATEKQRVAGARKRRDARTKREICRNEPLMACRNGASDLRLSL